MNLVERLRASITQARAIDRSALLEEAAAEIERLTAELEAARAAAPPCTVDADGHDSGTTRAPQE